jgi:hypothetical protein
LVVGFGWGGHGKDVIPGTLVFIRQPHLLGRVSEG